ncbi:MAG: tetratricopeptide repeat protein [Desulfomonile sp.]
MRDLYSHCVVEAGKPIAPAYAILLWALVNFLLFAGVATASSQTAVRILEQAKSEKDPATRIRLFDEALKNQSVKGQVLSSIFFERAMAYKEMNDCFRAIEDFDSALAQSKQAFPALIEKAECLIQIDQLDEASRVLELHLLSRPGTSRAYVLKGTIFESEGYLSKAEDEYTRALHYEPKSTSALEMRAKVRLKEGKVLKALDDVNGLIRLAPRVAESFMIRARIYDKLKDYAASLADYSQAEQMLPEDERITKEKVLIYLRTDQPEKALDALKHRQSWNSDVDILIMNARAHILLKNYKNAESILKQAISNNPSHAQAYLYEAVVLLSQQDSDAALENLNRAIELDPKLTEAFKERARIFVDLGDQVRASLDLTSAANIDPADGEIFSMRGLTSMHRMLYDAAIADFSRATENIPGDPRPIYDRAVAFVRKGEYESALKDLNGVISIKPDAARAFSLRGIIHYNLGDWKKAAKDFDKSIAINPRDALLLNNRGFFYHKIGDNQSAGRDLNRALELLPEYVNARHNLGLVLNADLSAVISGQESNPKVSADQQDPKSP